MGEGLGIEEGLKGNAIRRTRYNKWDVKECAYTNIIG